jgi:hypothetical protein
MDGFDDASFHLRRAKAPYHRPAQGPSAASTAAMSRAHAVTEDLTQGHDRHDSSHLQFLKRGIAAAGPGDFKWDELSRSWVKTR